MAAEKILLVPWVPPAGPLLPGTESRAETWSLRRTCPVPMCEGEGVWPGSGREDCGKRSGGCGLLCFRGAVSDRPSLHVLGEPVPVPLIAGAACHLGLGGSPVVTSPCSRAVPHVRRGAAQGPLREQRLQGLVTARNVQACGEPL